MSLERDITEIRTLLETLLTESDLPPKTEQAIKAKVDKMPRTDALKFLEKLHPKVMGDEATPEEGAKYHFLKSRARSLKTKPDFKTANVRTLSDYGRMKSKTDYTEKPLPRELIYSIGNVKLGDDTLIFNMGAALDCPSNRLGMCQVTRGGGRCYATKAETHYQGDKSSAIRSRRLQGQQWRQFPVDDIASQMLEIIDKEGLTYVRLNESGDFSDQSDVDKASQLADLLKGRAIVYLYTARRDLDYSNVSDNLIINGSGYMVHNDFHFVPKEEFDKIPAKAHVCSGECPDCTLCKTAGGNVIYAEEH